MRAAISFLTCTRLGEAVTTEMLPDAKPKGCFSMLVSSIDDGVAFVSIHEGLWASSSQYTC